MANLIVEIGNTALKAAWTEGTTLGRTFRYQGDKRMEYILSLTAKEKPEVMTVASTSEIKDSDIQTLRSQCTQLLILDPSHKKLILKYDIPEYLGYDRASGIIAARSLFKDKACTIFDFGTTLSIDFIESSGKYSGGNISLGCRMRFMALNRYSKSLPLLNIPERAAQTGTSIDSSIEAGVISGILFEVESYAASHKGNIIIFTGGDAIYFAKRMKNSIFVVSNLVLMGLAIITDDYVKTSIS